MVALVTEPLGPEPVAPERRRWPFLMLALALVLVVGGVLAGAWFVHWRDNFHPLASYPVAGARTPIGVGHTLDFDDMVDSSSVFSHLRDPGTLTVHISAIHPAVHQNTAAAVVTVEECVLSREGHQLLAQPAAQARARCATLSPFRDGTVKLGYAPGDVDIVVAVRPRHAGVTDVQGVQLFFTSGWRHGTQHTGVQATTVAKMHGDAK